LKKILSIDENKLTMKVSLFLAIGQVNDDFLTHKPSALWRNKSFNENSKQIKKKKSRNF
jgi:hypothetical protein